MYTIICWGDRNVTILTESPKCKKKREIIVFIRSLNEREKAPFCLLNVNGVQRKKTKKKHDTDEDTNTSTDDEEEAHAGWEIQKRDLLLLLRKTGRRSKLGRPS